MGYEKAEPRNGLILGFGILSVVTLVALQPMFFSYFDIMMGERILEVQQENPNYYRFGVEIEAQQSAQLEQGPIPIEQAMRTLANDGRGAIPMFQPAPTDPVQQEAVEAGWTFHPDYQTGDEETAQLDVPQFDTDVLADPAAIDQVEAAVDELEAELAADPVQAEEE